MIDQIECHVISISSLAAGLLVSYRTWQIDNSETRHTKRLRIVTVPKRACFAAPYDQTNKCPHILLRHPSSVFAMLNRRSNPTLGLIASFNECVFTCLALFWQPSTANHGSWSHLTALDRGVILFYIFIIAIMF